MGSTIIQLWHGIGVKKIDLATTSFKDLDNLLITKTIKCAALSDYYLSPSAFVDEKWNEFFGTTNVIRAAYPRNEVLLRDATPCELLGSELDENTYNGLYHDDGKKILLAPTWMDESGLNNIKLVTYIVLFCQQNNIKVFIKKHPFKQQNKPVNNNVKDVYVIPPEVDIYPHMKMFDAMVTDYSSIIFDYLLLDRPILTVGDDQGLDFDYSLIPGGNDFRYQFNIDNIASIFSKALFADEQSSARQTLRKTIFACDDLDANQNIAEKTFRIYEKHLASRTQMNVI